MFVKNLLDKAIHKHNENNGRKDGSSKKSSTEMDLQIAVHYGIPYTSSTLAFDPIQRLLAIGTLDGRIKIIGGDNIEGLLISPKKIPYKHLEFLQNQGFLVAISNENEIQVWNLEFRQLFYTSQWETNLTAFAVVPGTRFIFLGDENGLFSVLKYDDEDLKIEKMPYNIPLDSLAEKIGVSSIDPQSIVGILPQPNSYGTRVLIAYEKGLLVLWDIPSDLPISIKGSLPAHLPEPSRSSEDSESEPEDENSICSLCWAGPAAVAVGYITGDIYLWDLRQSGYKGKEKEGGFVKVQLASSDRRLPVIVLHWSSSGGHGGGQLFVYGGDEMGSEEVLTVLSIEFTNGLDSLKLLSRVDLTLNGSFADMILIPDPVSPEKTPTSALFVLTNPGQLNIYDCALFGTKKEENCIQAEKFPVLVPTVDPNITVTKFCALNENKSNKVLKKSDARKGIKLPSGAKWPLTGGVPSEISLLQNRTVQRLFMTGYKDGSVKIYDATFPVLDFLFYLNGKVGGMGIEGASVWVSALAFCDVSLTLAVGDECGLVRVYKLEEGSSGQSKHEGKGMQCNAASMVTNSPVRTLNYLKSGEFLSVGFENGQVAMLDVNNLSAIFCTESSPETSSPVISLLEISIPPVVTPPTESPELPKYPLISLSKDAGISILNADTGIVLSSFKLSDKSEHSAVSFYIVDGSGKEIKEGNRNNESDEKKAQGTEIQNSNLNLSSEDLAMDKLLLICCEDTLYLHSLRSIMQGAEKQIKKVKLTEHCCWSGLFHNLDQESIQLFLMYQTGVLEIRSLPDLEIVSQSSLMSILRWSFKTNMERTISSSDGQISIVNGSELAIISLHASENSFKIPESLPCLHDKLLASAVEAAINATANQKKKQEPTGRILGGIVKGLKGEKGYNSPKFVNTQELEGLFCKSSTSSSVFSTNLLQEEEKEELSIDDIEIDDVIILDPVPKSKHKVDVKKKAVSEREKLFEGSSDVTKPKMRSPQEILTKYKFGGDAAAAAAHAKDKLVERQEKLERVSLKSAELQDNAENFASMANELVRTMEKKKWWNI
ncbi:hypothetical protein LUZ60_013060 [Juncus effusus]|nr:hypothetical protein LUZ60_013060 [Juncus effusus]